jgi:hypothetical protein
MAVKNLIIVICAIVFAILIFSFQRDEQAGDSKMTEKLVSVDFEVFGIVQGN